MKAIGVMTFGGPEVLHVFELPESHARAGEVRIRVHTASVNPTDTLFRAGSQALGSADTRAHTSQAWM